jgi:hypothetical protein
MNNENNQTTPAPEEAATFVFDAALEEEDCACALDEEDNIVFDGTPTVGTNGIPAWHDVKEEK